MELWYDSMTALSTMVPGSLNEWMIFGRLPLYFFDWNDDNMFSYLNEPWNTLEFVWLNHYMWIDFCFFVDWWALQKSVDKIIIHWFHIILYRFWLFILVKNWKLHLVLFDLIWKLMIRHYLDCLYNCCRKKII